MTIPNFLTLFRLLLVPFVIWAIAQGEHALAFYGFLIAGITDGLDGFIAKRFNQSSELGAYLDPVADKTLLVSIYISLAMTGDIPRWVAILVVSRDVMIVGGVLLAWLMDKPVQIDPLYVSKANTAVQIVFAALVLASHGLALRLDMPIKIAMAAVALFTCASALAYVIQWLKHMAAGTEPPLAP